MLAACADQKITQRLGGRLMRISPRLGMLAGALAALTLVSACAYDGARSGGFQHVRAGSHGYAYGYGAPTSP
jgi:hypothetical protein